MSLEDVVLAFDNVAVYDMVKPEFVSIASERGGARLIDLRGDVRSKLEPQLINLKEDDA